MDENWPGVRRYVQNARLPANAIIAPAQLGFGIPYDVEPARAIAAINEAQLLVVVRTEIGRIPGAALSAFCLAGDTVYADETFAVLKKRKRRNAASTWLGQALSAHLDNATVPAPPERSMNGIYVDPRTVLTTTWWGDMIYVVSLDASITPHILRQGRWEHWIEEPFRKMLSPGMNVIDVGCNVGYYALAACKVVGPTGHVTAIDANPEMTRLVQMTLACNGYGGMSRVINAAVMKEAGEVTLSIPRSMLGGASAVFGAGGNDADKVKVEGAPLAQLVAKPARIDMLKIDAEGAEPLIYAGGKTIINRDKDLVIFMEFASNMIRATRDPQDFLSEIRADGFSVFEIQPGAGPVPVSDADLVTKSWTEILLVRDPARLSK